MFQELLDPLLGCGHRILCDMFGLTFHKGLDQRIDREVLDRSFWRVFDVLPLMISQDQVFK